MLLYHVHPTCEYVNYKIILKIVKIGFFAQASSESSGRNRMYLSQESLLYISIALRRNMSARIILRGLHRLVCPAILSRVHNVGVRVERLKCNFPLHQNSMFKPKIEK